MRMQPTPEQLKSAYLSAPQAIQKALDDGIATDFVLGLQVPYQLHIDTLGVFTALVRDTLLGFCPPADFFQEAVTLVGEEKAKKITEAFNTEVLLKLQKEERAASGNTENVKGSVSMSSPSAVEPLTTLPQNPAPTIHTAYVPTPIPSAPAVASAQSVPAIPSVPVMPPTLSVPPAAPYAAPRAAVSPPSFPQEPTQGPAMRTMAGDMQAVKEHRELTPLFRPVTAPVQPPPPPVAPLAPPPLPARTAAPPPDLPGAPKVEKYGVDPYREPVA